MRYGAIEMTSAIVVVVVVVVVVMVRSAERQSKLKNISHICKPFLKSNHKIKPYTNIKYAYTNIKHIFLIS